MESESSRELSVLRGIGVAYAHVYVGVIDRAHGALDLFTAAITPAVFHSAYLRLSLINDTVVLTPLKYRGGYGIARPRSCRDINNWLHVHRAACSRKRVTIA